MGTEPGFATSTLTFHEFSWHLFHSTWEVNHSKFPNDNRTFHPSPMGKAPLGMLKKTRALFFHGFFDAIP